MCFPNSPDPEVHDKRARQLKPFKVILFGETGKQDDPEKNPPNTGGNQPNFTHISFQVTQRK